VNFKTRLLRLERESSERLVVADDLQQRQTQERAWREAAWTLMQQTMSEEHVRLVVDAYAAGAHHIQSPDYSTPSGRLLRRCLDAISRLKYRHWPDTEIAPEVILARPPEVAQVYLDHDALPLHDCEACGFRVPVTTGEYKGRSAQRHFDACPLCEGHVGYAAYFLRRERETEPSEILKSQLSKSVREGLIVW